MGIVIMVIKAISESCTCIHIVDVQCTFCSCTYIRTENIMLTQCACIHVHVCYYGQEGTCIQLIRVICVTRTRKHFEYSDTNEIIKPGNITR